ncbi:MAG: antibiotic biosynthesis monooxygenase [Desulfurellaceae bacterium]|nr:antibiotic biosynthesis monooxygenase [Desulfurellaceae bacterium]
MVIVIFRTRLRAGADQDALVQLTQEMRTLVQTIPGFLSVKDFVASDGESVSIAEFQTMAAAKVWREHPEHRHAQERGRTEFFSHYHVQVCEVGRDYSFPC